MSNTLSLITIRYGAIIQFFLLRFFLFSSLSFSYSFSVFFSLTHSLSLCLILSVKSSNTVIQIGICFTHPRACRLSVCLPSLPACPFIPHETLRPKSAFGTRSQSLTFESCNSRDLFSRRDPPSQPTNLDLHRKDIIPTSSRLQTSFFSLISSLMSNATLYT